MKFRLSIILLLFSLAISVSVVDVEETDCAECAKPSPRPALKEEEKGESSYYKWPSLFNRFLEDDEWPVWRPSTLMRALRRPKSLAFAPRVNVKDLQHSYEITADVPGVPEENLKVEIPSPGILRISGKRSSRKEEKSEDYFHVETESGSFQRTFNIPSTLKASDIKADLDHGVLTIIVPKGRDNNDGSNVVKIGKKQQ